MDLFKILHWLSIKKVTSTLRSSDYFIVSRLSPKSPGTYETVAMNKLDFIQEINNSNVVNISLACSDLSTPITVSSNVGYYDFPYAFNVSEIIGTLLTAQTSGNKFTVDIKKNGVSILSTLLTIDNTKTSSLTSTVKPTFSTVNFSKGDRITVDVTQVGDGTAIGLIVEIIGTKIN